MAAMKALMIAMMVVFLLLCMAELLRRRRSWHDEMTRKFVHITVGVTVAFWPYLLSWNQIRFLSLAFAVVVVLSQYLNIFKAIHSVERPTWGELMFAVAVGVMTFMTHDPIVYSTAILQMSLADGFAAVIGTRFGKSNSYRVFRQRKSWAGTVAFFIVSMLLLVGYTVIADVTITWYYLALLAALTALIENISVRGLDNLLVPIVITAGLRLLG
jgi:phytol kinase